MTQKITIARNAAARTCGRILAELSKFTARKNEGRKTLENIQATVHAGRIRLVAANGWILAVCDIPVQTDDQLPNEELETLIHSDAIIEVARDLKKGPRNGQELTVGISDDLITLSSEISRVSAPPGIQSRFPDWQRLMPEITEDEDFNRFVARPALIARAAALCSAMKGHMAFTAANGDKPIRIDCIGLGPEFNPQPRTVIVSMPIYAENPVKAAINLHPSDQS